MSFRLHKFFRWLLFLWVKVAVFPKDTLPFESDSTQPVLYVLADRGLSDFLVLSHTTNSHCLPDPLDSLSITPGHRYPSVYCVTPGNTMIKWLQRDNRQLGLLQDVLNSILTLLSHH